MTVTSKQDRTTMMPPTVVQSLTICDDDMQIVGIIGILSNGEFRAFDEDGKPIGTFRKLKVAVCAIARRAA